MDSKVREALFFDTMLTPKIITFVYWLSLFFVVIAGFGAMFSGFGGVTFSKFIYGLLIIVGGALGARIWCEILIVIFKINENIKNFINQQSTNE